MLKGRVSRRFYKLHTDTVKDHYILSTDEMAVQQATQKLFETFDFDGSGGLDSGELVELYNQYGVPCSEDEIKMLYGGKDKVYFTLEMFQEMARDPMKLREYRNALSKVRQRIRNDAQEVVQYMPTTFDSMMAEFGNRVARRELVQSYDSKCQ